MQVISLELSPQQVDYTRGKKKKRIIKPLGNHCMTFTRARSIINQAHAIFQLPPSERCAGVPQLRNVCLFILHYLCNLVRQKMHV